MRQESADRYQRSFPGNRMTSDDGSLSSCGTENPRLRYVDLHSNEGLHVHGAKSSSAGGHEEPVKYGGDEFHARASGRSR